MNEVQKEQETKVVVQRRYFPSLLYICLGVLIHIWMIGSAFSDLSLWSIVVVFLWPFYLIVVGAIWFFTKGIFWVAAAAVVIAGLWWIVDRYERFQRNRARRRAMEKHSIGQK